MPVRRPDCPNVARDAQGVMLRTFDPGHPGVDANRPSSCWPCSSTMAKRFKKEGARMSGRAQCCVRPGLALFPRGTGVCCPWETVMVVSE